MKKWEYIGIWQDSSPFKKLSNIEYLNELGKKGWELVYFNSTRAKYSIFKREKL